MSPVGARESPRYGRFPRVSGDEPAGMGLTSILAAFSPREWG